MKSLTGFARLLFALFFIFFSIYAQAQFSAGAKAGINYATLTVDDDNGDYGFTPGFQIGAFVDYTLTKVNFQLDIMYSQQGASIKANGEDLSAVSKYVNIPIVVKYKIVPAFNLQVGPQIGFLTCLHSDYHPIAGQPFEEQDYTKAYKGTDFGVNIGAGWESPTGLMIDIKYYIGLSDISDYAGVASTKNSMAQLTVAYKIFKF